MTDRDIRIFVRVHLLLLALVAVGWAAVAHVPDQARRDVGVVQQHRCEEDEPCWDCSTMGNHVCGPRPANSTPTDPGCASFANGQGGGWICIHSPRKEAPKLEA